MILAQRDLFQSKEIRIEYDRVYTDDDGNKSIEPLYWREKLYGEFVIVIFTSLEDAEMYIRVDSTLKHMQDRARAVEVEIAYQ